MKFSPTSLPSLVEITGALFTDKRGSFLKVFHEKLFADAGISFPMREQYFSLSHANVIRGMHFQLPPHHHAKLVYCPLGRVLDVLLDLRPGDTYGKYLSFELSPESGRILYIPPGLAHGFAALTDNALMVYNVSTVYDQTADSGIRWDSFNFPWPTSSPILSDRDAKFIALNDFKTPFRRE